MEVIDLDRTADEKRDDILYITAHSYTRRRRNLGDMFLSFFAFNGFGTRPHTAFLAQDAPSAQLAVLFAKNLDFLLVTSQPVPFLGYYRPVDIFCGVHNTHAAIHDEVRIPYPIGCPWMQFLINRTTPAPERLTLPAVADVPRLRDNDVILFPCDGWGRTHGTTWPLAQVAEHFLARGATVYQNVSGRGADVQIPGALRLDVSVPALIALANKHNVFMIGVRSGIFDILYFTGGAPLVPLIPAVVDDNYRLHLFDNPDLRHYPDLRRYVRPDVLDLDVIDGYRHSEMVTFVERWWRH